MKIVHALGWYFPESLGGTEVYVDALARTLQSGGHEVLVAAPDPERDSECTYSHNGVQVFRYPIPRNPSRGEAQSRLRTRGSERLHRWLERVGADVFHCHSIVTGLGLQELRVARSLGARVVITCHTPSLGYVCQRGTMMRWGEYVCDGIASPRKCASCALQSRGIPTVLAQGLGGLPAGLSKLAGRIPGRIGTVLGMVDLIHYNASLQEQLLDTVDAFVVLTDWAKNAVAANHRSDSKLVLNRLGIEAEYDRKEGRDRGAGAPVRFGYVGRLHATKGVFVLAEAMALLPRRLTFSLEIRGPRLNASDGRTDALLRERLASDSRVRFEPAVSHAAIGEVLESFDVFVCPSVWLEGGPTVALEAQAVGTPVLGSRIGGLAEIVDDGVNGRLVPPGDATALASAMAEVVGDPEIVRRWRRNLRKPRTMKDIARDYEVIYERGARG